MWTHPHHHLGVPPLYSLMAICTSSCWRAFFLSSCLLATRSQSSGPQYLLGAIQHTIISLDAGERFSQKEQLKVEVIQFLVDTPLRGTPEWRQSHDLVTRTYVSCNGSIFTSLKCDFS